MILGGFDGPGRVRIDDLFHAISLNEMDRSESAVYNSYHVGVKITPLTIRVP